MAKTILVPTDFTIRSLNTVKQALRNNESRSLEIIFFTGFTLNDSIMDLLFFSKESAIDELLNEDFKQACQIIKNKYGSRILEIRYDIFVGFTHAAFSNFVEGNSIDELYIPENSLHYPGKCFDPSSYMIRSNAQKTFVSWAEGPDVKYENHISELFTSWT